ncbi:CNNM domain-containing protein [Rhodopirellula sallentina]|uniref:Hemolysin n=1 Tax=Rhodopirellula sallentina SM41 TaxID=1263870 RepID=M5TUT6_9BACT|nr:hemolysin family protein [Rhodopirellula sallentina]EMI52957.1 hemolysin [Rhodopirellula sallentina SM41]
MFLLLTYLVAAIGFSFYCSVAEAVLLSITPSFIATLRDSNAKAADRLKRLKANVDRPLAAILSLNTIAHTIGAAGVGAQAAVVYGQGRYGEHAVGIASAVMTLLILVFSEIIPKTIGALHWRRLGPTIAMTVEWLIWLLYPLVWLSEILTKLLSGGHPSHALTRDELSAMAEIGVQQGVLEDHESRVFRSLMKMPELSASDIMTPRVVIIAYNDDLTIEELFASTDDLPVSRIPIYHQKLDDLTGFVLKNDLLLARANGESQRKLSEFSRPLKTVHATTPLPHLLEQLLEGRFHLAMVSDQYGSIVGLVTLEDLVETLLGLEIVDESDAQVDMQSYARKRWEERATRRGIRIMPSPDAEPSEPTQSHSSPPDDSNASESITQGNEKNES